MSYKLPLWECSEDALREVARMYQHDNYVLGELGYCAPASARWTYVDALDLAPFLHLQEDGLAGWERWFACEVKMDEQDGLSRDWKALLVEPIREEVVVLVRQGKGYIWDGWHRVGASLVAGRPTIKAIVGYPF